MTRDDFESTRRVPPRNRKELLIELPALRLVVTAGKARGCQNTLVVPLARLGTARDNDVVLTDDTVSQYHATLAVTATGLRLTDLNSTNGTFVGGARVYDALLEPGLPNARICTTFR